MTGRLTLGAGGRMVKCKCGVKMSEKYEITPPSTGGKEWLRGRRCGHANSC